MARILGGPGWFWPAGYSPAVLTIAAALSFGELASMMPGGAACISTCGRPTHHSGASCYGWTLFTVIQTGTIAAVAVAFARFLGVLAPSVSESHYLVAPLHLSSHYALTLSTAQLVALFGDRPSHRHQCPRHRVCQDRPERFHRGQARRPRGADSPGPYCGLEFLGSAHQPGRVSGSGRQPLIRALLWLPSWAC